MLHNEESSDNIQAGPGECPPWAHICSDPMAAVPSGGAGSFSARSRPGGILGGRRYHPRYRPRPKARPASEAGGAEPVRGTPASQAGEQLLGLFFRSCLLTGRDWVWSKKGSHLHLHRDPKQGLCGLLLLHRSQEGRPFQQEFHLLSLPSSNLQDQLPRVASGKGSVRASLSRLPKPSPSPGLPTAISSEGPHPHEAPAPAPLSGLPSPHGLTIHLFSDVSSPRLPLWASEQSEVFLVSRPSVTLTVCLSRALPSHPEVSSCWECCQGGHGCQIAQARGTWPGWPGGPAFDKALDDQPG
ncbi:hypothetical protein GH733_015847 [Mirounga leonina]|nr:hypothetical protein GH733_015847 [Mirounga leonina]